MTDQSTTSSPSSTLDRVADDPRPALVRAEDTARAAIAAVSPDQMDRPTPCEAFDVAGMVAHLVSVLDRITVIGRQGDVFDVPDRADLQPDGSGWLDRWDVAAAETREAWADDALLETTVQVPWDRLSGRAALGIYVNEVTVHTWDLARATDQEPEWDPEVLAISLAAVHAELPLAERAPIWEAVAAQLPGDAPFDPPFGDAVPVPEGAPLVDRVVAWNGRQP